MENPKILKPLLSYCGIGSRAIARDLGIPNLDTYNPRVTSNEARQIAEYLTKWLRGVIPLDVLVEIDRAEYADTQKRTLKGAWEKAVRNVITNESGLEFVKRRFVAPAVGEGSPETFELDLAFPKGGKIKVAIDVKRIEARQDYQKRSDEILGKAAALKRLYYSAKFAAFVYYPFNEKEVQSRLNSPDIDEVVFAGADTVSIRRAAKLLLEKFELSNLQSRLGDLRRAKSSR